MGIEHRVSGMPGESFSRGNSGEMNLEILNTNVAELAKQGVNLEARATMLEDELTDPEGKLSSAEAAEKEAHLNAIREYQKNNKEYLN